MPLHVAYLADGHNYHIKKWVRAMAEVGLKITLITFRPPEEPIPGVTVVELPIRLGTRAHYSYLNYVISAGRVRKVLAEIKPDVLLGSYATHYGWLAGRTGFQPFVLQTWTLDLTHYSFVGLKRFILGPIIRRSLARARIVTTDGPALRDMAVTLFPGMAAKFVSVLWGVRLAGFDVSDGARAQSRRTHAVPDNLTVVTSPRGLLPIYRPEVVLSQLLSLLRQRDDVFVIVLTLGHKRTPVTTSLIGQVKAHDHAKVFDQFVSAAEMQSIFRMTDIVVSVPVADGVSEALLESLYAGAYPVVSDIPSNRSLLSAGVQASVVEDRVILNLYDVLVGTIAMDRTEAIEQNRAWVKTNGSVEKTALQMRQLFESVVESHQHD